jgi:alpha/beta superfamily hydrolase
MRRPEITGFISVSPPANMYDFSFLAPCPSSGLIINGTADRVAPPQGHPRAGRQAARAEGHHHHP